MDKHTNPVIVLPYRGHIETMATFHAVEGRYQFDYQPEEVKTIQDYNAATGKEAILATWDELNAMHHEYKENLKTPAKEITEALFFRMLEILPPCKWHSIGGVEVFHISERLTDNLVSWFAHYGNKYAQATLEDSATDEDLQKVFGGLV